MLITHNAINLERPSEISRSLVEEEKKQRLNLSAFEAKQLKQIKEELHLDDSDESAKIKKKKKRKGVNPLSMKKRKKTKHEEEQQPKEKKKRRRTRQLRISGHWKEFLRDLEKNFSIREFLGM